MRLHVRALLDRPSSRSFVAVPFVAEGQDGTLEIHGLERSRRPSLTEDSLQDLVEGGHVLAVDQNLTVGGRRGISLLAGWIGDRFREESAAAGAPPLGNFLPAERWRAEGGEFWLDKTSELENILDRWLREAARISFSQRRAAVAERMVWVLPRRDETRAALWYTRPTQEERERELAWWLRLEQDAGEDTTHENLAQREPMGSGSKEGALGEDTTHENLAQRFSGVRDR